MLKIIVLSKMFTINKVCNVKNGDKLFIKSAEPKIGKLFKSKSWLS